jgi:hypothetical protein
MPSLPFMSMEPYIKKGSSLTQEEKALNMDKFLELLEAVWAPEQIAVMHCQGQHKVETTAVQGN